MKHLFLIVLLAIMVINISNCGTQNRYSNDSTDTIPPTEQVTDFEAGFVAGNVVIVWTNPTETDFDHVIIIRKEGSAPSDMSDGAEIYTGSDISFTDREGLSDATFYYVIYTCDASGNCMDLGKVTSTNQSIESDNFPLVEICNDDTDNDGDDATDCDDADCWLDEWCEDAPCGPPGISVCNIESYCANEVDDDQDGKVDCQDPDCFTLKSCP